jgi:hypothetical protein
MNAAGSVQERLGVPDPGGSFWSLTGPGTAHPPIPSQAIIKGIGDVAGAPLELNPKTASLPMQIADYALPFLATGGRSALNRIGEAKGLFNKSAEALGYTTGALTDAGLSYAGGVLGEHVFGAPGGLIGSVLGGGVRPTVQRGAGWTDRYLTADPDAPAIYSAMKEDPFGPQTMPTYGQLSGPEGKQFERSVGAMRVIGSGVNAARDAAERGIQNSVATGVSEVAGDSRLPDTAPVSPDVTAGRIIDLSREMNASEKRRVSADQQALEDAIGTNRPAPADTLADTLTGMSNAAAAPVQRTLRPRINDLYDSLNPQDPAAPGPLTAPYGHMKDLRADLRENTPAAPSVKQHYYDQAYDAYTGAMRSAADEAGQGPAFDRANRDYWTFENINQPWLERQGGSLEPGAAPRQPSTVASRVNAIPGPGAGYLAEIATHLGLDPARATIADVMSRMGRVNGQFSASKWAADYAKLPKAVQDFVAQNSPEGKAYLDNAAKGGATLDIQPERPGLSKSVGGIASFLAAAAKYPRTMMAIGGGLETPSVIRSMAGKTDIPALVEQYARRQGVAAGMR